MTKRMGYVIGLALMLVGIGVPAVVLAGGSGAQISDTAVFEFPGTGDPVGDSKLIRSEPGVNAQLKVDTLTPGDAYTMWWVIFNEPSGCSDACGEDDIFDGDGNFSPNPDTNFALTFADGKVANRASGNFEARLSEGEPSGELVFGPGLVDSTQAEIHLVIRSHGPALTGDLLVAQITTFGGACNIQECVDTHFAVHQP